MVVGCKIGLIITPRILQNLAESGGILQNLDFFYSTLSKVNKTCSGFKTLTRPTVIQLFQDIFCNVVSRSINATSDGTLTNHLYLLLGRHSTIMISATCGYT